MKKEPMLRHLIQIWAKMTPEAVALLSIDRPPLTYGMLAARIDEVAALLRALGISRNERVAIVLPNGAEMAVASLGVMAAATAAPLNPAYREEEFTFYLGDLGAKALLIQAGLESAARGVAERLGIPCIELHSNGAAVAGSFTLSAPSRPATRVDPAGLDFAQAGDVALVLHTSGTTSRPKIVPLTHENLSCSAHNVQQFLQLGPVDRCLNVMPLFHIHGLVAALLASLVAGGSVICTPGFSAPRFFEWMDVGKPTWYTAVPTMHQAILTRAALGMTKVPTGALRFIRSCSASLPPKVLAELEGLFGAPVVEAYGMTEAAHQMACNPLPPATRKPGSVGLSAGPEVAIMDEDGRLLARGTTGEIVIRGRNVMAAYENRPEANASAFTNGWFRTGDQGFIDEDGYIFLTGRIKEIINRGGEKIAPREVEEVLLEHPAVEQVAVFAVPHPVLGEDVAAVIMLHQGTSVTEQEVRLFAADHLVDFKVPARIVFAADIPKGPTGKVQRLTLARALGLTENATSSPADPQDHVAPATPMECMLVEIYRDVFNLERIGLLDDFLFLGGDSLLAAQIVARVQQQCQVDVPLVRFFELSTIQQLAAELLKIQEAQKDELSLEAFLGEIEDMSEEEAQELVEGDV